jgi:hypothetical protein
MPDLAALSHQKLYVFDLYPTKPSEHIPKEKNYSEMSSITSNRMPAKLSKQYLKTIKEKFNQRKLVILPGLIFSSLILS